MVLDIKWNIQNKISSRYQLQSKLYKSIKLNIIEILEIKT